MNVPWDAATARACGIDALRRAVAPGCGFGRAAFARERSFGPGDEALATAAAASVRAAALAAGAGRLETIRAALAAAPDPARALGRARMGETLEDADFFDLVRFNDALGELRAAGEPAGLDVPAVDAALAAALAPGRSGGGAGFYLSDAFDPALADVRVAAAERQAAFDAAQSRLAARAATALGLESIRDGEFVVMRDLVPGPLPREIRVLRDAPTYRLCELALDGPALAALGAREAAASTVARAEETVRARLSRAVARAAPGLEAACERLGRLDLLAAKAAFTARYGGVVPELAAGRIVLADALYPPLADALAARGRAYAPLRLELEGLGVVTGPNMGGKTAALRTLGFAAACAVLGIPVPAAAARLPLPAEIAWLGVGHEADGRGPDAGLLSAFGAEVVELRGLLERGARPRLILIDEFARTTSPREGRALLVALVTTLREGGAVGLVATHLDGVAAAAGVAHYTSGRPRADAALPVCATQPLALAAALDAVAARMEYALVRVPEDMAQQSGALALAATLGLDAKLLARAAAILAEAGPAQPLP